MKWTFFSLHRALMLRALSPRPRPGIASWSRAVGEQMARQINAEISNLDSVFRARRRPVPFSIPGHPTLPAIKPRHMSWDDIAPNQVFPSAPLHGRDFDLMAQALEQRSLHKTRLALALFDEPERFDLGGAPDFLIGMVRAWPSYHLAATPFVNPRLLTASWSPQAPLGPALKDDDLTLVFSMTSFQTHMSAERVRRDANESAHQRLKRAQNPSTPFLIALNELLCALAEVGGVDDNALWQAPPASFDAEKALKLADAAGAYTRELRAAAHTNAA